MGYMHIENLYREQEILMFRECFALEKIHGTSAHIGWRGGEVTYFSGGERHGLFASLFDEVKLKESFSAHFPLSDVVIYGEAYGGKQQGMRETYGERLKFIAFDVRVGDIWLNVSNAEDVCNKLGIEFVFYKRIPASMRFIDAERDAPSEQAKRNGCGDDKPREGIVLRPLIELTKNNGGRIICKHKGENFKETKTAREVSSEELKVLEDAKAIAEEWVTEMRLLHVLDKLPPGTGIEGTALVLEAMREDVARESAGETVLSKEAMRAINSRTAVMFKNYLKREG